MIQAIYMFEESQLAERQARLPFENGAPGVRFCRRSTARRKAGLKSGAPTRREGKRGAAFNIDTLISHLDRMDELVRVHSIDTHRMWSLDGTEAAPGGGAAGRTRLKR